MRYLMGFTFTLWLTASSPVGAASIELLEGNGGKPNVIAVDGDLEFGDEKKFVDLALKIQDGFVVFSSKGGNLVAGIKIGQAIRLKGLVTFVPDHTFCASACALAWLGGQVRLMASTAAVGFHSAYLQDGKEQRVSITANALAGAYLNSLGLPERAVVFISEAPPDGMSWLSLDNAGHHGITVSRLDLRSGAAAPLSRMAPDPSIAEVDTPLPNASIPNTKLTGTWSPKLSADQEFTLRIVSGPNGPTGVWRILSSNPKVRNYYIVVEAVAPDGQVLHVPVTSEEDGQTASVSRWGIRVTEEVFNVVRRDKEDDGVVQQNRFGEKRRGQSHVEFAMPVVGGAILRW
jgi:hypothetical protein